jgi:hypothetical protein
VTLLGPFLDDWPRGAREALAERVAIRVIEGRQVEARARDAAEEDVRREVDLTPEPRR